MANAAKKLEVVPADEPGTDIVAIVMQTPVLVLNDAKQRQSLYAHIEREIEAFVPDVTTAKGREAIKSLAFKVTKTKTAIDAAGKLLNEEARSQINVVDEARRDARNTLDILAERARKPLTDWEEAEKARIARCREIIEDFKCDGRVTLDDTADTVRKRGAHVWNIALDPDAFLDMLPEAQSAKDAAVETLKTALARLIKEEADRAELEKLRAAETERLRVEAEKEAAAEIERKAIEAARIEEERKAAAEKADAERIANAEKAAAEKVQREIEDRHAKELARINRGREMLAYIREVVSGRIGGQVQPFGVLLRELESKVVVIGEGYGDMEAEIEQARVDGLASLNDAMERQAARAQAEEDRAAERARLELEHERIQNKANRAAKKTAAKQAIMTCGVSEEAAQKIVLAIIAKEVPGVTLSYAS